MNFLSHCQLAWPDAGLVAGAIEGDYFKGPLRGQLAADIEAGVVLHRAIDAYSDSHPVIADLRQHFPPQLRRHSGILIDLTFDYYLSHYWQRFGEQSLASFSSEVYRLLESRAPALSPGSRRMVARLVEHDLLNRYGEWDTILRSAAHIARRLRRPNSLADCEPALSDLRPELEAAFLIFYPQLGTFVTQQRALLSRGSD